MVSLIDRLNRIAQMSPELIQQLYNIVTDKNNLIKTQSPYGWLTRQPSRVDS